MKLTTTALVLATLALTKQAFGKVCYGTAQFTSGSANGDQFDVAWIYGKDACSWTYIANTGNNPCGTDFTLSNGYTYYLGGCGTSQFALYNANSNTLNALAEGGDGFVDNSCNNQDGDFTVTEQYCFG